MTEKSDPKPAPQSPDTEAERKDTPSAAGPPPPENTTPEQVAAPRDWQRTTQPEKPFETEDDRAAAEKTKPQDLEFTTDHEAPTPEQIRARTPAEKAEAQRKSEAGARALDAARAASAVRPTTPTTPAPGESSSSSSRTK